MEKQIQSALISVFSKEGLKPIVQSLHDAGVTIYSTGGTQSFIEKMNIPCTSVESITGYPAILGGRVKTLHPLIFGGILGRRNLEQDVQEMQQYKIPKIDLVIVDLYPFDETVQATNDEKAIIEKIDIGGPSMIRAAAKNFKDVLVVAHKNEYESLQQLLSDGGATSSLEQRKAFAARAFDVCTGYDLAISNYFNGTDFPNPLAGGKSLRYGENPHQHAAYHGDLNKWFTQIHGKELSFNNLVDVDAALQLMQEFESNKQGVTFAIIKHTNVCGIARRDTVPEAFKAALAGDPESAFGGILISNAPLDQVTAAALKELFFEVLIAPEFLEEALPDLQSKKKRILLQLTSYPQATSQSKSLLGGTLVQDADKGNTSEWNEAGGRQCTEEEKQDLLFANIVCKHLKSNAIAIVKDLQLVGKGCGQTSRVDALRQAIAKANQFEFDLKGGVVASDAFFPFDDCVKIAHEAGVQAFIQPGGSIRDKDSIAYCKSENLAMVLTGMRHFRH